MRNVGKSEYLAKCSLARFYQPLHASPMLWASAILPKLESDFSFLASAPLHFFFFFFLTPSGWTVFQFALIVLVWCVVEAWWAASMCGVVAGSNKSHWASVINYRASL